MNPDFADLDGAEMMKDLVIVSSVRRMLADSAWLEPSSRDQISAGGVVTLEDLSEGDFPPVWDGYIERLVDAIPGTYASVKSQIKALLEAERQGQPGQ